MFYKAKLQSNNEGGYIATFEDVPEAITEAPTKAEALTASKEALETMLLQYADMGRGMPDAKAQDGIPVFITPNTMCKLSVIHAFREAGITQTELARRLDVGNTIVRRILSPFHSTKLDTLEKTLNILGKRLVISVEAAE